MSLAVNHNPSSLESANTSSRTPPDNKAEEQANINDALDRLLAILPEQPYILTVPSYDLNIDPWKLRNEQELLRQAYPFRTAELHHQYMSFMWRDSTDSCFEIKSELDEERERRAKEQKKAGVGKLATASPLPSSGTKKKISLAAYKNKLSGGDRSQVASPAPPPSGGSVLKESESQKPATTPTQSPAPLNGKSLQSTEKRESLNRPKKRPSPEPSQEVKQTPRKKIKTENPNLPQLPPMVSPLSSEVAGLPPMLSPLPFDLPPMLSPTLPPELEEQIEKVEKERRRASSNASNASDKKESTYSTPQDKVKVKSKASTVSHETERPTATPTQKDASSSNKAPKRSLIVTIKTSRRISKDIERILHPRSGKLPAKSHSESTSNKDRVTSDSRHNGSNGLLQTSQESSKKRPPDTDNEQPVKKHRKMLSNSLPLDENVPTPPYDPSTPQEASPFINKTKLPITPKENGSSAMARSLSNLSTPRQNTPLPPSKSTERPHKSSPLTAAKQQDANRLTSWSKKFNDMGRKLKHEAQAISASSSSAQVTNQHKIKAIRNIECVMSYMIAYSFNDARCRVYGRPTEYEASWNTLQGMIEVARTTARHIPVLEGLCCYLGYAVDKRVRDCIGSEMEYKTPLADEDLRSLWKKLARVQKQSRGRYQIAQNKLSPKILRKEFPDTYNEAEEADTATFDDVEDMLATKGLSGPFALPISEFIVPSQTVRFGISLIKEWIGKQKTLECELKVPNVPNDGGEKS